MFVLLAPFYDDDDGDDDDDVGGGDVAVSLSVQLFLLLLHLS